MADLTFISGVFAQSSKWQVKWQEIVQNDVFPIPIYEFFFF